MRPQPVTTPSPGACTQSTKTREKSRATTHTSVKAKQWKRAMGRLFELCFEVGVGRNENETVKWKKDMCMHAGHAGGIDTNVCLLHAKVGATMLGKLVLPAAASDR